MTAPTVTTVGALVAGIALAIVALVVSLAVVAWLRRESPNTYARKETQAFFTNAEGSRSATVTSCAQIGSDEAARIYRCQIEAPRCVRTHRFVVYRDRSYGTAPYSVSAFVNDHPCRYPSD